MKPAGRGKPGHGQPGRGEFPDLVPFGSTMAQNARPFFLIELLILALS